MNAFYLEPITNQKDKSIFIKEVQIAFQKAYENEYGPYDQMILPIEDIEKSFNAPGSIAYFAWENKKRVGGVIVVINENTQYNFLHLLYVNPWIQNAGYGYKIWKSIEKIYLDTKIWETHTPYFDKRNIHFYVNRCGFKIVEFFNSKHKDPHQQDETTGNIPAENNLFFRFEKEMTKSVV
ncbi:GNAT family N-acetyltransferase [Floccifex sp.]|uniref:GNAT family N-acetyltransferase n=1 Tax=Floccifex sp. TaxID=2815810 RepID=UPI003F059803